MASELEKTPAKGIEESTAGLERGTKVPKPYHLLAAAWIISMVLLSHYSPGRYYDLLQEDRVVEWATVGLFLAAGCIRLITAIRRRRAFDALVALFCIFVAGEEFSWGQRLLGVQAPEYFLANNYQQEVNLHNLPQWFVQPKWVLIAALAGYGLLLPLLSSWRKTGRLLRLTGATTSPVQLAPWFIASVLLLVWYPLTLTGEWVELLAGSLFLVSAKLPSRLLWIMMAVATVFGYTMTRVSDTLARDRNASQLLCAKLEVQGLVDDITFGDGATDDLRSLEFVHKRLWTAINEGYLNGELSRKFDSASCEGIASQNLEIRRQYGVDPWGSPYWLSVEKISGNEQLVVVYSFGPNRRRDVKEDAAEEGGGDDIFSTGFLDRPLE